MRLRYNGRPIMELLALYQASPDKERRDIAAFIEGESAANWPTLLQTVEAELQRLAIAIAEGGQMGALLDALRARQHRRDEIRAQIAAAAPIPAMSRQAAERAVRALLADWRGLLTSQVQDGRELLRRTRASP